MYRSKEQHQFANSVTRGTAPGPALLLAGEPGLGKTRAYLIPLLTSGKRVAIALNTRQQIDQLISSSDLAAAIALAPGATVAVLKPRSEFSTKADYVEHRRQAIAAQVLVITHAAAVIDSLMPAYAELRDRDVVLFDEADQLPDAAALRADTTIPADSVTSRDAKTCAQAVLNDKEAEPELKAAARAIVYAIDHPAWYRVVGFDEAGDLVLRHRLPGRMLGPLLRDAKRTIFVSGTLQVDGRFDHFVRVMGLKSIDPASRPFAPTQHGTLNVMMVDHPMSIEQQAVVIANAKRPTLVVTTRHTLAAEIGALIPGAVIRADSESLNDAVARTADDGILIAAGAWAGLDVPRLRWKSVVLPAVPYGVPIEVEGEMLTHYLDSRVAAVRRTYQAAHRGLRSADAVCDLLLLDHRYRRQDLAAAVPARFQVTGIDEGGRKIVIRNEEVRALLRVQALELHGARCKVCGDDALHRLEVHHLYPVNLGQRRTNVATDLVVLCRNHHADAHETMDRSG